MRYCPALNLKKEYLQAKRLDWELLKLWSQLGLVCLKYLDESGCYCTSPTDYAYGRRGEQKRIRQNRRRGRRINIFGIWEPKVRFDYALMVGTLKTPTYVQLMNWQAQTAATRLLETGQITAIIHDNASVHKSSLACQQHQRWQQQGLYIFFLPPYSPQMNRIEDEWLHLKRDELAGQVFEDEYELAIAIIDGINNRANHGHYQVERFTFN
ncbi:transposase [Nostoc punctiforme]|uniref:transposase n=1 Tax=Nostoc punctiforme TaxID=272131 RepID=UPI000694FC2E|nr:transposase [Nostoc punctiforme]